MLTEADTQSVVTQPMYHGSNTSFREFKRMPSKRYVLFSEFDVNSPAFFFSPLVKDAKEFGPVVTQWNIRVTNPLFNFETDPHLDSDFDPEVAKHLEYILEPMLETDEQGRLFIDLGVSRYYIDRKDDRWSYFAVDSGGINWDVTDNEEAVRRMQELGYDGTTVSETDTYAGYSWAIFDSKQAEFVGVVDMDEYEEEE